MNRRRLVVLCLIVAIPIAVLSRVRLDVSYELADPYEMSDDDSSHPVMHPLIVGPDGQIVFVSHRVYHMIWGGRPVEAIKRELEENPRLIHDSFLMNKTLLAYAAGERRDDVVRLLLEMGADPNGRGEPGEYTPLMTAVEREQETAARILVEHGADPDLEGAGGSSPRQLAASAGNERMLSILAGDDNQDGGVGSESTPKAPD